MEYEKKQNLSKKLLSIVLLVSGCATLIFTAIRFYNDFKIESDMMHSLKKSFRKLAVENLKERLYLFDDIGIRTQMSVLEEFKEVVSFHLKNSDGSTLIQKNVHSINTFLEKWDFPISYESEIVGHISINITKKYMYEKLFNSLILFFIIQVLKTFLVSLIIFIIFNRVVVLRIKKINYFLEKFEDHGFRDKNIRLDLDSIGQYDDLNFLGERVKNIANHIVKFVNDLDKEIILQKSRVINASKLAAIGEMAGGIAHEINNPLAIIDGNNSIINTIAKNKEYSLIAERSDIISRMVIRVQSIILSLRKFSREENSYHFESVELKSFINETLSLCKEKFKSHGIKIECIFNINPNMKFNCNQIALSQVFINILNNGYYELIKHSQVTDKIIIIEVKRKKDLLSFSIKNNAGAISKSISEKIFQPFFTTKKIGEGTGLGMSVAKGIIEQHKGTISVKGYENWTEFIIKLPE